jgi:hypothetical protein
MRRVEQITKEIIVEFMICSEMNKPLMLNIILATTGNIVRGKLKYLWGEELEVIIGRKSESYIKLSEIKHYSFDECERSTELEQKYSILKNMDLEMVTAIYEDKINKNLIKSKKKKETEKQPCDAAIRSALMSTEGLF